MSEGKFQFCSPRSSHSHTHENGAPWLEGAEAAVLSEPRARSDRGEPRPAHGPAVREWRAVEPRESQSHPHITVTQTGQEPVFTVPSWQVMY